MEKYPGEHSGEKPASEQKYLKLIETLNDQRPMEEEGGAVGGRKKVKRRK